MIEQNATYGTIVRYDEETELVFPDFRLLYLGDFKEEKPHYVHKYFIYLEFLLTEPTGHKRMVRWTPGTGEISEYDFMIGDETFILEFSSSSVLRKRLNADELVAWKAKSYRELIKQYEDKVS